MGRFISATLSETIFCGTILRRFRGFEIDGTIHALNHVHAYKIRNTWHDYWVGSRELDSSLRQACLLLTTCPGERNGASKRAVLVR